MYVCDTTNIAIFFIYFSMYACMYVWTEIKIFSAVFPAPSKDPRRLMVDEVGHP
jgi:hypothetical protein